MILDTMTMEEIQAEVSSIYQAIHVKATPLALAFLKKIKSQFGNRPLYWKHQDTIKINNNTIIVCHVSKSGRMKDFAQIYFLQLNNSKGYKEYYQIMLGGIVRKLSKHFIDRFIERTGCDKENFLIHVCKEFSIIGLYQPWNPEPQFVNTANGLIVMINNIIITYLNDLSQYKSDIKDEVVTAVNSIEYTRRDAMKSSINGHVIAYKIDNLRKT